MVLYCFSERGNLGTGTFSEERLRARFLFSENVSLFDSKMERTSRFLSLSIKILVLLAIVGVGLFVYQTCSGTSLIQTIDKTVTGVEVAPFQVVTRMKTYCAQKVNSHDDGSVVMTGWYDRVERKWVFRKGSITLPKIFHPMVSRRVESE